MSTRTGSISQSRGVFVGRERELSILTAGLEQTIAGRGQLFLIGGEPGIGKSRLADVFDSDARQRGVSVLWGRCWEAGGAPAYWPWVQSIRAQLRDEDPEALRRQIGPGAPHLAKMLPEIRDLFPDLPDLPSLDPETARFQLFDAAASFLKIAAQLRPLVLIFDDLHAADTPSLLLLQFLAGLLPTARICAVGTFRTTELTRDHPLAAAITELVRQPATHPLLLGGLSEPDVARFIELTAGIVPPEQLVSAVHGETEGNPLFVGEVVRLLVHEGRLERAAQTPLWRLNVPQGVRQVIARRLAHLSEDCNAILTIAAVFGREFSLEALERVSGTERPRLFELLDEAERARVIIEAPGMLGSLRFSHVLIREGLYEELTPTRRVRLHQQIGETLETLFAANPDPHLAELAYHFFEAASGGTIEKAITYAKAAADRAVRLLAYEEAIRLYQMALQAVEAREPADETLRCDLLLALGDAQARAGDASSAKATYLSAADVARARGMAVRLARAALGYGGRFVWEAMRGDRHLVLLLEEALAALGPEESALRVRLMVRLAGGPLRDDVDRERRAALSKAAVEMARRIGDASTLAYALDGRYAAIWWPENLEERLAISAELIRSAEQANDKERALQGHHYRSLALLELGDMPGVYAELEAKAHLAEELKQPPQLWYLNAVRATLATFEGRFDEAERLIPEVFKMGLRAQGSMAVVYRTIQLYTLRREQGRSAEAEDAVRRAVHDFRTYPVIRCLLAHLSAELGRTEEAREILEHFAAQGFTLAPPEEWLYGMSLLAEVGGFLGERRHVASLYDSLLPFAHRAAVSAPDACTGSIARPLGILATAMERWEEASRHFNDALKMNRKMGARPWVAWTQFDYAQMLAARSRSRDREAAADLLTQAITTARELCMVTLLQRAAPVLEHLTGTAVSVIEPARAQPEAVPSVQSRPAIFLREGEYWVIEFEGDEFRLRDAKGLRYIARLLQDPGREFLALDLIATEERGSITHTASTLKAEDLEPLGMHAGDEDLGPLLDEEAKAAYRRRLDDLDEEIEEAEAWHDTERAARAQRERELLIHELKAAVGLGGRHRKGSSPVERARVNATRAIKAALARIAEHSPALGRHFDAAIRTGTFCSYRPDPRLPARWQV